MGDERSRSRAETAAADGVVISCLGGGRDVGTSLNSAIYPAISTLGGGVAHRHRHADCRATFSSFAVFSTARMTSGAPPSGYCGSVKPNWKSTTTMPGF